MNLTTPLIRFLHGMEPDKYDTNKLNINGEGCWADAEGLNIWNYRVPVNGAIQIDMMTVGLNGRDQGPEPANGTDWYLYLCANPDTGHQGAVLSRGKFYDIAIPDGYTSLRKLPFGFVYNSGWDGIPNFHFPAFGWSGLITFTDASYISAFTPLVKAQASQWTDLDLSGYIPDNARMAWVGTEVRAKQAQDGSAYIRSYVGQGEDGFLCGSVSGAFVSLSSFDHHFIRVTSDRHIQYRTTGGASLILNVEGYVMTEPS